jgi:hypothetical protein
VGKVPRVRDARRDPRGPSEAVAVGQEWTRRRTLCERAEQDARQAAAVGRELEVRALSWDLCREDDVLTIEARADLKGGEVETC